MDVVSAATMLICMILYVPTGVFGYLTHGANTPDDISKACGTTWDCNIGRVCVGLTAFFSYPLLQFVARTVVRDLFFAGVKMRAEDFEAKPSAKSDEDYRVDTQSIVPETSVELLYSPLQDDPSLNTGVRRPATRRRYCCKGYSRRDNAVFYLTTVFFILATTTVSMFVPNLKVSLKMILSWDAEAHRSHSVARCRTSWGLQAPQLLW